MSTSQLVSRRRRRALNRRYRTALFLEPLEMRRLLTSWPVWEPVGPTPVTGGLVDGMFMQQNPVAGGVHTLAPHPSDANVMYVGTVGGGVWKTTSALDTQPTWRPLTDFVQVSQNLGGGEYDYVPSSISALVFDTADATHQTLYAGIGALSSSMPRYMFGVVRTTDGGESWEHIVDAGGAPVGLDVSGLAVNGDQIIVGGLSVLGDLDPPARLWYSVDGGESFVAADHPHHEYFRDVSDILADPADPHIVYVAELFTEAADNQPATQSGIYRINSTQGVWTFEDISDHSDELGMATAMATSNSVKLAAGRNGELYVGIMNAGRMESLFRTNDARAADVDWQRVRLPSYEEGGQFAIALHSDVHDQRKQSVPFSVAVDPTDPWVVYLGGDRQPGDLFTPPDDEFSEGGMNAVGAAHKTGRLLRGQIIHDADGRIVTTVWQGVTHAGAVPAGTPSDPVQGASNERPIRVHSPGHGLSDGDRVMVYDVSGNTAANGLWTVTPNGADHFLLDGADGQASAPHVAGTGRWLRYEGGSAPGRNAHDLAFDNAGNLIVACDGGVYRKADPRSPIGSWQSLHGNLQIADTSSIAWDHNQHVASGTVVGAGVAIQNVRDQKAWGLLEGSGSQLYAVSDGAQDRTVYYFGQAQLGNLKRKTIDLAAETSEVVDVELRVDALAFDDDGNLAPAGLALQAFDYGFDRRDDGSLRGLPTLVASPVNPDRFAVFVGEILYESTDGGAILRPLQEIIDNNSNNRDDDGDGQIDDGNEFLPNRPSARLTAAAYGELGPQGADAQDALYYADTDGHNGHIYLRRPGQSDLQLVYEFPDHRIWQLLVDPRDWHHVFAVILNGDVMESSDAGGTWVSTIRIPSSYEIGELVFVTAPFSDELIMWSDQQGLLAMLHAPLQESRDSSWLQVAGNLPVAVGANKVADLDYDRRDDTLVVATAGRGAWKLPHASQLLTVPARTGDITELDLDPLLRGSDYRLTEVAMRATQAGSRYFSITGDADQGYQLRRVLDEAGHFTRVATLWSPRELEEDANGTPGPTFGDSGRLYLEPSLVNNLLDDSDADERGFQGQMELTFTYRDRTGQERTATLVLDVAAGCSGSVATSITMNVTRLDNLRLAHRLRYLGELALMPENQGNGGGEAEPPPLAPDVAAALRLFQSVIDTHGELLPGDASGELSFHTMRWLNSEYAPRWKSYGGATEDHRYGAGWLVDLLDALIGPSVEQRTEFGQQLDAAGIRVASLSAEDGTDGRAGMAVTWQIPEAPDEAARRLIVELALRLRQQAAALFGADAGDNQLGLEAEGLLLAGILVPSDVLLHDINAGIDDGQGGQIGPVPAPTGFDGPARQSADVADGRMQVRFAAPTLDESVAANESDMLASIIAGLRSVGDGLGNIAEKAIPLVAGAGLPFVDEGIDGVLRVGDVLQEVADRLQATVTFEGSREVTGDISQEIPILVVPERHDPISVRIMPGSTTAAEFATALNAAFGAQPQLVAGSTDNNILTLSTTDRLRAESVSLTTLRLESGDVDLPFGQLPREGDNPPGAHFQIGVTVSSLTGNGVAEAQQVIEPLDLRILPRPGEDGDEEPDWPDTRDNVTLDDLVADLNAALQLASIPTEDESESTATLATYLLALSENGRLVIASRHAGVQEIRLDVIDQEGGRALPTLGFETGVANHESEGSAAREAVDVLGLQSSRVIAEPRFGTVAGMMRALFEELDDLELLPDGQEELSWTYDAAAESVLIDLSLDTDFDAVLPLDFTDGFDLGPLGRLEFTAQAEASVQAALGLHLQLGIYLGEGDSDVRLTPATRLEEYGVTQLVGIVANSGVDGVDSAGVIEEDATFTLTLNGGPGQGGSEYAVRVRQADTLDNLAVPDLIADIDRALAAAGLSGQVQARYDPEAQRLILLATGDGIHEMAVSTNEALGFRDQRDNLADLTITSIRVPDGPDDGNEPDDADTYRIDLHGAQTLEQVIEAVANETGGAVTLRIDADRPALIVAGPADEQLVVGAFAAHGLTSTTAVGLGILGTSGSNELRGQSLAHIGIADRIFLAEPDAGESTIELTLTLGADVDLRAALGLIGFEVASVEPIELGFTLPVRLRDPGVGDAQDGRITVSELLAGDVAALVDIGSSQGLFDGATLSGALELSADLFGQPAFSGPLATIRLSLLVPQDLTTVTITPENVHADLAQLGNLSPAQIVAMIRSFVTQLTEESETSPLLSTELPLVERSLGDIVQSVDEVLAWLDTIVASVDPTAIRELRDRLESAIVDLDRPRVEKAALFRALGALDRVLAADVADLPALLVSATAELRHAAEPFLAELDRDANDNPLLTELRDRLSGLQNLVPSLNTLAERLNAQLPDNLQITLDLPYYDANEQEPNEQERALVIGLRGNFAPDPWEFEPELPAFDVGPIELSVDASATLYASGSIGLGMGLRLGALDRFGSPGWENIDDAAFLIVNPPRDGNGNLVNPNLVPTQLELQAGFAVQGDGTVQFGGLELIEASADLSLLAAREETVDVEGSTATLPVGQVPRGGNPRFVIVAARGGEFDISSPDGQRRVTVLPPEYFEVIENQIRFFVDEHAEYHVAHLPPRVSVTYQTNDYPATPADPGNADQQASVTVDFGEPDINNNLLGAVAFADLFGEGGVQPRITAAGLLAGALDASFLGQHVEDAVTLAVALDHLTDPILTVDTARLTSIWDQLDFDLLSIFDGIEALLQLLENGLRHEVASQIPLIGDLDPRVIQDVREDFVAPIREFLVAQGGSLAEVQEKLQTRIFELLGRGEEGLGILGHRNEDGTIGPNGVLEDVQVELNKDRIEFQVILVGAETIGNVDFSSGLGGLPLEAQGGVSIDLGYTIIFGVGYHRTEGFYYLGNDDDAPLVDEDNQPLPEFSLDLDVAMQTVDRGGEQVPASLTLDLFLITFSATDRGDTGFEGTLSLDVDCGPGGHLRLSDLAERSFGEVFAASLSTVATIDLRLDASINDDLPHLTAELEAGFGFALTTEGGVLQTHYGDVPETPGIEPYFSLDNITLDLGDFLSKYLGPAITKVLEILQPVQEVVEWLTEPVPGISDLSELVGGGPITLLDMVAWKEPEVARAARKFVNVVQSLGTITGAISTATADGIVLRLGGVSFFGDGLTTPGWNRDVQLVGAHPGDGEPDGGGVTSVLRDPAESVAAQLREGQLGDLTSRLQRAPDGDGSDDGLGIKLHFLELPTILKIVLGQTANVISWDIPTFAMDFDWDARFPVIPVPPISVAVGAHVGFTIDLSVGYDTRGLETGYFADGFFFGDLADVFAGDDIDEFRLTLGGTVAALLDVVVASAGIEGELRADLTANWRDPNQDGKMYLDEIARIINQDGPLCLFNLKLELHAILRLVWEVLFYSGSLDIVDFPVVTVDNSRCCCPSIRPAHVADGAEVDELGQTNQLPDYAVNYLYREDVPRGLAPPGTLILHAGQYAELRQSGATDTSEHFIVTQLAPGVFEVEGQGIKASYSGVSRILFDGGNGNDRLEVVGLGAQADDPANPGVDVPIFAFGGDGIDVLWGGSAHDVLEGGIDDDILDGRSGEDFLDGQRGDDQLTGGADDDIIRGGLGDDVIQGNGGADVLLGGAGIDTVYGANRPDEARDLGADLGDYIEGNPGNDWLWGGADDDEIHGGSGEDHLYGQDGEDELYGDSGHDWLDGGPGDDPLVYGGDGNDLVIGDDGFDRLFGGWGNDVILAHRLAVGQVVGADGNYIEGGPDDDFICGDNGRDEIYGGTADAGFTTLQLSEAGVVPLLAGGYRLSSCVAAEVEFEEPAPARIQGQKFLDTNGNHRRDDDEQALDGFTIEVYDDDGELITSVATASVDLNGDGAIDPLSESGVYRFQLGPGTYTIREVQRHGYRQTFPETLDYELTVDGGAIAEHLDFGNQPAGYVTGTVWDDLDSDGRRDQPEPGMAGLRIYVDENGNGVFDAELETLTATTGENDQATAEDEAGQYVLELPPGNYDIRGTAPPGYDQTYPRGAGMHRVTLEVGETIDRLDFGNHNSNAMRVAVRFAPAPTRPGDYVLQPYSEPAPEWEVSYVEIWLAADQGTVDRADMSLWYDARISVPVDTEFGPAFDGSVRFDTSSGRIDVEAVRQRDPSQPPAPAVMVVRIRLSHAALAAGGGRDGQGSYDLGLRITNVSLRLADQTVRTPSAALPDEMIVRAELFDVNDDDVVDARDYQVLVSAYGRLVHERPASWLVDFDGSGRIDVGDISLLVPQFGRTSPDSEPPENESNVFVVNSTADPGDGVPNAAELTLREAITAANATANRSAPDRILFNIPPTDPGHVYYRDDAVSGTVSLSNVTVTTVADDTLLTDADPDWPHSWFSIAVRGTLPAMSDAVDVDGYSQPGAIANTLAIGTNAIVRVEINGSNAGSNASGLWVTGDGNTISGLAINRFRGSLAQFSGFGIYVDRSDNNVVEGNYLGTDVAGVIDLGNATNGLFLRSSFMNRVGGTAAGARNVVAGNDGWGINIFGAGQNTLQGNYVGLNAAGTAALGNNHGVWMESSTLNTIGGTVPGAGNTISGNSGSGIDLVGYAYSNLIVGNFIGTDPTGRIDLGNSQNGVTVEQGNNTIGGTTPAARNVISGNSSYGIRLDGASATGIRIEGNFIGTDATGTAALGNTAGGVWVSGGATGNTIGGAASGAGNVVSANQRGVVIQDSPANHVLGNLIGTQVDGTSPLGNTYFGITIANSSDNRIGGLDGGAGNTVAFNGSDGVYVVAGPTATRNTILGNRIFSNTGLGIDLYPNNVTPNDPGDGDSGANDLQNFPELTSARVAGTNVTIGGELHSTPHTTYRIEFFASAAADPSGFGEGQDYLGSIDVTADAGGSAVFEAIVPAAVPAGQFVTATATVLRSGTGGIALGETSEFSRALPAEAVGDQISGLRWHDANANGVHDTEEPGVAGITIFADLNLNGRFDAGEPTTTTQEDDPATPANEVGRYGLNGVPTAVVVTIKELPDPGTGTSFPYPQLVGISYNGFLVDLDRVTGAALYPRSVGGSLPVTRWIGISQSPADGRLYGIIESVNDGEDGAQLYVIDPYNGQLGWVAALVDPLAYDPPPPVYFTEGDVDFDPTSGVLYAMSDDLQWVSGHYEHRATLSIVHTSTGFVSEVGELPVSFVASAMAFDANGNLFVLDAVAGALAEVDKGSGLILRMLSLDRHDLGEYAAMDFDPMSGDLFVAASGPLSPSEPGEPPQVYRIARNESGELIPELQIVGMHNRPISGAAFLEGFGHRVVLEAGQQLEGVDFGSYGWTTIIDGGDIISAADGDDTVYGDNVVTQRWIVSEGGPDCIFGGRGGDEIFGQERADDLWGECPDADALWGLDSAGDDDINGGADSDTVWQTVDADQLLSDELLTGQGDDRLFGIEHAVLTGGANANHLDAHQFLAGSVVLRGLYDDDHLSGTMHNDTLVGGEGGDTQTGGDGDDTYVFEVPGVPSVDHVHEVPGADPGGSDTLDFSAFSADFDLVVYLDRELATMVGSHEIRVMAGWIENVVGGAGNDHLLGNFERNRIEGGPGNDILEGANGNDLFVGGPGDDQLIGGKDNDYFMFTDAVGEEYDEITAREGVDTIDFAQLVGETELNVDLSEDTVAVHLGAHGSRKVIAVDFEAIEDVVGTNGDDIFADSRLANRLAGGLGDDTYVLVAVSLADTIVERPNEGIDWIDASAVTHALSVDLSSAVVIVVDDELGAARVLGDGRSIERFTAGPGGDDITGNALDNVLEGGSGNDVVRGEAGRDVLIGGIGDDLMLGGTDDDRFVFTDVVVAETDVVEEEGGPFGGHDVLDLSRLQHAQVKVDLLSGIGDVGPTHVFIHDAFLFETVLGGALGDMLIGHDMTDNRLVGGPGNDVLNGRGGNDVLIGGAGDDVYIFESPNAAEDDQIDERNVARDADGQLLLDAAGRPLWADGGTDTLDFRTLTAPIFADLGEDTNVARHEEPGDPNKRRTVTMIVGSRGTDLEIVQGGHVGDFLRGNRGPNRLEGGEGDDTLDGAGGDDVLIGGPGANLLIGGAGDDRYVFTNGVAAVDTLVENAGSVVGGVLSVGGIDTLDLSDVEDAVTFDLSHFVPDVDPFDGQDRIPEFVPGVVPGVLEIDLHDRTAPLDDHTRTGEHFETVVLHGGQLGLGFRLASARGNTDLTNPTATSDPASKTEPMQGDIGFLGTPGTRGGRALGEGDSPCLEVRLIPVAVPTAEDATELPSPLDSVLPGQVFFLELWALSIVEPSAGVAGGMVDIEYPSGIVTAGPPAFPSWLELISGSVAASAGLIDDWGGVILARDAGVDPDWVRLGHIPFTVIGQGNLSFDLLPGEFPFALMGMGNVAWTDVVMFDAQLAVIPVNQPPVIATSGSQTLAANTTTTLPLIQLSDPDGAADARLTVTLSVLHGTLLLNTAGVDVVAGGNRKALVSLAGTVAALNAALRTLGYRSHADFAGSDALTIIAQETDGSGGSGLTATAVVALQVQARPLPYRNPRLHLDVNDDGHVSPRDALIIINLLNREGTQQLLAPTEHFVPPDFLDTSGDNWVSPRDALLIINYLNASPSGEGEAALSPEDALQLAAKADGPSIQRSRASSELRDSLWAEETDWLPGTDTLTDREHATATVLSGRTSRWRSRELQMSSTMYTLPNGTGTSDGLLARSPGRNRRSPNRTS